MCSLRASAIVFQAVHRQTHLMVAVKIMIPDEDGEAPIERIQSEIGFLIELSGCPYIVSFLEGFHYRNNVWVRSVSLLSILLTFPVADRSSILCWRSDHRQSSHRQ
jgi:serine/threonine protein kinase